MKYASSVADDILSSEFLYFSLSFVCRFFIASAMLTARSARSHCVCHTLHMTFGNQPKIGPYTKFKRFLLFYSAFTFPLSLRSPIFIVYFSFIHTVLCLQTISVAATKFLCSIFAFLAQNAQASTVRMSPIAHQSEFMHAFFSLFVWGVSSR